MKENIVPVQDFQYFYQICPTVAARVKEEVRQKRVGACGIIRWNLMWAYARLEGVPVDQLPPRYEQYWGHPGDNGWDIIQAFEHLGIPREQALSLL